MTVLAGGVGGARMARALRAVLDPGHLTVVVNVGDDTERYGVHVAADPDTVLYTLAEEVGPFGWGRRDDTTFVMDTMATFGFDTTFTLGDKDLALCLGRTVMLDAGIALSEVTEHLSAALGVDDVAIVPATNDTVRTWVRIEGGTWLPFQDYFVDRGHADAVTGVAFHGSADASPAPGVIEAIDSADTLVIAPSNPPLSIWPILAIDAIEKAVRRHPRRAAVSPLFGGRPLKGPADTAMRGVGLSDGTRGILEAYHGLVDELFIDVADSADLDLGSEFGVRVTAVDTRLTGADRGRALVSAILEGGSP